MWGFREKSRQPWIEEALQREHIVILELERRLGSLESVLQQLADGVATAKAIDRRLGAVEMAVRGLAKEQGEDASRQAAAIEALRSQVVGLRGGRPRNEEREAERQALELGRRVATLIGTPQGRAQLIAELQGVGGDVDALGNPRQRPVPESPNGSAV